MQIDKAQLKNILNLSDDEIKKKVANAVNSSKLDAKDKESLDNAIKGIKDLKKTIGSIDNESLKNAMNAIGSETIEELKKKLK